MIAIELIVVCLVIGAVGYAIRLDRIVGRVAPLATGLGYRLAMRHLACLGSRHPDDRYRHSLINRHGAILMVAVGSGITLK